MRSRQRRCLQPCTLSCAGTLIPVTWGTKRRKEWTGSGSTGSTISAYSDS